MPLLAAAAVPCYWPALPMLEGEHAAPCVIVTAWPALPDCTALATSQVRGDVGEVAPDGRVLRPARLTVQLEAPGAHRRVGCAGVGVLVNVQKQGGCLPCDILR